MKAEWLFTSKKWQNHMTPRCVAPSRSAETLKNQLLRQMCILHVEYLKQKRRLYVRVETLFWSELNKQCVWKIKTFIYLLILNLKIWECGEKWYIFIFYGCQVWRRLVLLNKGLFLFNNAFLSCRFSLVSIKVVVTRHCGETPCCSDS